MTLATDDLKTPIEYPDSDGEPMAESDPARDYLLYSVEALNIYFQNRDDVYVSGNLFIYYKKGIPSAVVAPDVFVIFGIPKIKRMSYKLWEENNKAPDFILEITSRKTQENDEIEKPRKYLDLGVKEYFQYDPTGDYLPEQLKGRQLSEGKYKTLTKQIYSDTEEGIYSEVLGLELRLKDGELRFYDPITRKKLLSYQETELARQQAELARQQAELERQQAELARQQAELERQQAIPRLRDLGLNNLQIAQALNLDLDTVQLFLSR